MQIWKKKTLNIAPILNSFSKSHCMVPTPIKLKENYFRVFMDQEIRMVFQIFFMSTY